MKKQTKITANTLLALVFIAIIYILSATLEPTHMVFVVLKKSAVFALVAVSMNLLNGFTGLFSLGQAGFMLLGSYTYAALTIAPEARKSVYQYFDGGIIQFALPVVVAIIAAGLVCVIFAWLIGMPVLRLKSDYLAIATLGFAEILRALCQWDVLGPITNGSNMLRKFPSFDSIVGEWGQAVPFIQKNAIFFSTMLPILIAGLCIAIIVMMLHSTYGRAFKAIRDDEVAAEAMGIKLARHKMISFCTSAFFAGIGGALLAMYMTTVQANAFKSAMTYEILLIVVIGGIGSISGSCIASFLFVACSEWWLRFLDAEMIIGDFKVPLLRNGFRLVVFSVIIMLVVLFYRRGIMGDKEFSVERIYLWFKNKKGGKKHG